MPNIYSDTCLSNSWVTLPNVKSAPWISQELVKIKSNELISIKIYETGFMLAKWQTVPLHLPARKKNAFPKYFKIFEQDIKYTATFA